jgi:hypothetical protein
MRRSHAVSFLALLGLLLGGLLIQPPRARAADEQCFAATGFCVHGRFLEYWQTHGGLALNGYPLSDEHVETLEDGQQYSVQYFERVRMELHPENQPPYDVLLGQFGRRILREAYVVDRRAYTRDVVPPAQPVPGEVYFAETEHNISPRFLDYWQTHGGLAQFGYPITEERYDILEDGKTYQTQYFERARLEYHPENDPPYDILSGQFGRRILAENTLLHGTFETFFLTNEEIQVQLGGPVSAPVQSAGATQPFEHGWMVYASQAPPQDFHGGFLSWYPPPAQARGLTAAEEPGSASFASQPVNSQATTAVNPTIYVFCGGAQAGAIATPFSYTMYFFPDTWTEGQPVGGGPGPQPGLYQPQRGFGKVWTSYEQVRGCLGYATTPAETALPVTVQYFTGGALLLVDTPTGRAIYAVAVGIYCNSCSPTGAYRRFPAP